MQRLKNIEFLRIVGCLAIVWLHFLRRAGFGRFAGKEILFKDLMYNSIGGLKAVDLFFILSGMFLVLTTDFSGSIWEFTKKKLIRFYPVAIVTLFGYFVISRFCNLRFLCYENFLTICNMTGTPLSLKYGNISGYWYISILLWVFLFIFYCRKYFRKETVDLCVALLAFFSYAFIIQKQNGLLGDNMKSYGTAFNVGLARGFGGIGIGYFIGEWYKNNAEKIRTLVLPIYVKLLITAAEGFSIVFVIYNMMFRKQRFRNDLVFIMLFVIIIVCFLLKQGYISRLLDRDIWSKLSVYTFSIYVTHFLVRETLFAFLWTPKHYRSFVLAHPFPSIIISITAALVFGVLAYHLVERPAAKYLKRVLSPKNE